MDIFGFWFRNSIYEVVRCEDSVRGQYFFVEIEFRWLGREVGDNGIKSFFRLEVIVCRRRELRVDYGLRMDLQVFVQVLILVYLQKSNLQIGLRFFRFILVFRYDVFVLSVFLNCLVGVVLSMDIGVWDSYMELN